MRDLSKKMSWFSADELSSHERGKREVWGRDWCPLIAGAGCV